MSVDIVFLLKMTTTQDAEVSVTVNNSPFEDYSSCMFTLQVTMLNLLIK